MRYAALSLPRWPTDRLKPQAAEQAESPDAPFVLTLSRAGGERLYAVSALAEAAGLSPGMGVADARALVPRLVARAAEPEADKAALNRFARWCGRFSPWTAPDLGAPGLDGVLLDIAGCAHLFGGEAGLLDAVVGEARGLGLEAYGAIAPTLGLAWGLARHGAPISREGWVKCDTVRPALDGLPVEALRVGQTAAKLRQFGLTRVDDLLGLPRAALARRFGMELVRRLDQACGQERESLTPLKPQTDLRARVRFPEPLQTLESLEGACARAIENLCEALRREALGVTRLRLTLYRVDGQTRDFLVGASLPSQDPEHLSRLMRERLARSGLDIGFGIDLVEAGAALARRVRADQTDLSGPAGPQETARLSDRLNARLGAGAVRRPVPHDSHIPERAVLWQGEPGRQTVWPKRLERRPVLILDHPEPAEAVAEIPDGPPRRFTWRRVRHDVRCAEGPERIAPEWWRAHIRQGGVPSAGQRSGLSRDYFRVETGEGRRFWLYREGLYGRETDAPSWFVHGAG